MATLLQCTCILLACYASLTVANTNTTDDATTETTDTTFPTETTDTTFALNCCHVWKKFVQYIPSKSGEKTPTECTCPNSRIRTVVQLANEQNKDVLSINEDDTITMQVNAAILTDLVILNILGSMVAGNENGEHGFAHYKFNENTDTLVPNYDNCKFEKDMYVTLLCVTIIVLITLLVLQMDAKQKPADSGPKVTADIGFHTKPNPPANGTLFKIPTQNIRHRHAAFL